MRWKLVRWLTIKATDLSNVLIKDRNWNYSFEDYRQMPENSLGRELYLYMIKNEISFKPNLVRHDLKHILLGYEMKMPDELKIHAFLIGNRCINPMGIVYLIICTLIVPEVIPQLRTAFKRGKIAKSFRKVNLQDLVPAQLIECQNQLKISN